MVEFRHATEHDGIHVGDTVRLVNGYSHWQAGEPATVIEISFIGPVNLAISDAIGRIQDRTCPAVKPLPNGGAVVDLGQFVFQERDPVHLPGGWRFIVEPHRAVPTYDALQNIMRPVRSRLHLRREEIEHVPRKTQFRVASPAERRRAATTEHGPYHPEFHHSEDGFVQASSSSEAAAIIRRDAEAKGKRVLNIQVRKYKSPRAKPGTYRWKATFGF